MDPVLISLVPRAPPGGVDRRTEVTRSVAKRQINANVLSALGRGGSISLATWLPI